MGCADEFALKVEINHSIKIMFHIYFEYTVENNLLLSTKIDSKRTHIQCKIENYREFLGTIFAKIFNIVVTLWSTKKCGSGKRV